MKQNFRKKQIKEFFKGFLPLKKILVICILFYILGIVFAFVNSDKAHLIFPGGMFLDNLEAKIQVPAVITFDYFLDQFIFYLGAVSFAIFLKNLVLALLSIFSGVAIIPVILVGFFMKMGAITYFAVENMGFKGILIIFGSLHVYFEALAALLSIETFFKFYISLINSIRNKDINIFKNKVLNEIMPLIIRITLLLAIAAIMEVFWSTWWVYILTHPYVSWYNFYFGAYSIL